MRTGPLTSAPTKDWTRMAETNPTFVFPIEPFGRLLLREIVKVFSSLAVKIVVLGTGLSLEEVGDAFQCGKTSGTI